MSTRTVYSAIAAAALAFFAASIVAGIVIGPLSDGGSGEQLGVVVIALAGTVVGAMVGWRRASRHEQHRHRPL